MAPVNGASNKPTTMPPTKRTIYPPAIPHMYSKKKDQKKTPQTNGSLNSNGGGKPSSSENGQTVSVGPSPIESAAAVVPSAQVTASNASADSRTVVAAPNGHPKADSFALSEPAQKVAPTVSISNAPSLNGPAHELSPVVGWQQHPAFRPPFHNPHHSNGHHPRLSNGSFAQNGFQESTSSSPIPHSSSAFLPPNPFLPPNAIRDGSRPPAPIRPSVDGVPAFEGGSNGPLTSGSFHDSQSSRFPDDVHRGQFPVTNGHGPFPIQNGHGPWGANGPVAASHIIKQNVQHEADTLQYLRSGAAMPDFPDCVLELHFPDTHVYSDHPDYVRLQKVVRLPAHRFILARSGALRQAMQKKDLGPGGVLVFHLGDKYMRSDVVCAAIRTMYGWSLGECIPYTDLVLRHQQDHMMLTLSYMAAGQDLQLPWVFGYAMQRAISLFEWDTVDLAVDFALSGMLLPRRSASPFDLGELMHHAMRFILLKFPQDFVLDVKVGDGGFPRLPRVGTSPEGSSHPSATGSCMPSGQRPSNPGLQKIRFGDLSAAEQNGHGPAGHAAAPAPRRAPTGVDTVLSRILLNLPYEFLKEVLEAPSLGGTLDLAKHLPIAEIIAEREARRMRALNRAGPELISALERAAAPPMVNGERDFYIYALGFKEEVCFGDGPFLVHTWTISPPGSEAA
ncbi:hypothetical protein B0T18DRAFT_391905 [Schizothecium vesticola]|uniref:BTB domain-containing protein n=1 Tax=Schizothecium vesticola TaxID=314040 RepID=A0AA40EPE6_9PEZI|nr:hypothetical protein B0T18DRAFT_391905 [Schizothecium vesticola]